MDAALYDFIPPRPKGKTDPHRKKGARQPTLQQRLNAPTTKWIEVIIPQWCGHGAIKMLIATGTAIWYHSGMILFLFVGF